MTTPDGNPAWTRTSSAVTYGGDSNKADYASQGVVNPRTDVSAAQFLRLAADVSALARVAPFSILTVLCNDTVPAAPTVVKLQQMGTVSLSGYAGASPPDANLPTLARVSDGKFTITWPSTNVDDFGVSGAVTITHVSVSPQNAFTAARATASVSGLVVTVSVFDGAGAALDDALVTVEVA